VAFGECVLNDSNRDTGFQYQKDLVFTFRNCHHVFSAFHIVNIASFKSKQSLVLVRLFWQSYL